MMIIICIGKVDKDSRYVDNILLMIANWTYHHGNEDSFEFLCELDLVEVSVKTLLSVIRDYPNMREDACFKGKHSKIITL